MHPTMAAAELQKKLLDIAKRDSFVTTDAAKWGKGKLDVAAALGIARKNGAPPKVTLVVPDSPSINTPVEVKLEVEDDADGVLARWDLDYDGKPDTVWEPIGSKTFTSDVLATKDIKVEVLDADGYLAGATARIVFGEPKPVTPASAAPDDGGCGCNTPGRSSAAAPLSLALALVLLRRRKPC
jgi:MYXO-CTERM domain-containing protein